MRPFRTQQKKGIAVFLGSVVLGTQCLFAYQQENNIWVERRRASHRGDSSLVASLPLGGPFPPIPSAGSSLSQNVAQSIPEKILRDRAALFSALSPAYGTVRKVSVPQHWVPGSPVVIHIQDVHMNQEAQWHIRETVRALIQSHQVDLIALEGATREINLQPFVDFPSHRAVKVTADYLLKKNKITGPIHAAMTANEALPKILGIDDPIHYAANIRAYQKASVQSVRTRSEMEVISANLQARQRKIYSPKLMEFDEKAQAYQKGILSLGDYARLLAEKAGGAPPSSVRSFLEALTLENKLDFKQVERERTSLIAALTPRLDESNVKFLLSQTIAYRSGQIRYAEFYDRLTELCRLKGLSLFQFPALASYVRYVGASDRIDGNRLQEDIADLEKRTYNRLGRSPEERALVLESFRIRLAEKLVNFSLSPVDWKDYRASNPPGAKTNLFQFESFYREAQARDVAMSENLLKSINASGSPPIRSVVLVTGGYHSEGMTQLLVRQGVTVVSFVPRIEKIDADTGSAYLSVFSQEKTPLEKLFTGEKLFLGIDPAGGISPAAAMSVAVGNIDCPSLSKITLEKFQTFVRTVIGQDAAVSVDHLTFEESIWNATVGISCKNQTVHYSLTANRDLEILSFQLEENERTPLAGRLLNLSIKLHNLLTPLANKMSPYSESLPLFNIDQWTPADYLWFLRRHAYAAPEDILHRLIWAGTHSFRSLIRPGQPLTFLEKIRFHSLWNKLESVPMAATKKKGKNTPRLYYSSWIDACQEYWEGMTRIIARAFSQEPKPQPKEREKGAGGREKGSMELKRIDGREEELVRNGRRQIVGKVFLTNQEGKYLILWKQEKGKGDNGERRGDLPGGGVAGRTDSVGRKQKRDEGVSVVEGAKREVGEETHVYLRTSPSPVFGAGGDKFRYFFVPGSRGALENKRVVTFSKIQVPANAKGIIKIGKEHVGKPEWKTLAEILDPDFFPKLNTIPKMGFYLKFLEEAYGISGVKSLIPLNDLCRLKHLNDDVLIETDSGWYLYHCPVDKKADETLAHYGGFSVGATKNRSKSRRSTLLNWPSPTRQVFRNGRVEVKKMRMDELAIVNDFAPGINSGEAETIGEPDGNDQTPKLGSLQTRLLDGIPAGSMPLESVRIDVQLVAEDGVAILHLLNKKHKNECPGGGVDSNDNDLLAAVLREMKEELGDKWGLIDKSQIKISQKPLLYHSILRPNGSVEYRTVYVAEVRLTENTLPRIDWDQLKKESQGFDWDSPATIRKKYATFTLASRMVILRSIIWQSYGIDVAFFRPALKEGEENEFPLLIETARGDAYILQKVDVEKDIPKNDIVDRIDNGEKLPGKILQLSGQNFVLVRQNSGSEGPAYPSTLSPVWERNPWKVGIIDNILRKAPFESSTLALLQGTAFLAHFLGGASILWVMAVPLLAFGVGWSHSRGTYGVVGENLKEIVGAPSLDKAVIGFVWTSAFAGALLLVGQWIPPQYVGLSIGVAAAAMARVSFLFHQKSNREWLVQSLPDLTAEQRAVAREILTEMAGKPLRMGVGELRELIYKMAENNSQSTRSFSFGGKMSRAPDENKVDFIIVDPSTLDKPGNVGRLIELTGRNDLIAILPRKVEGIPDEKMIVAEGKFDRVSGGIWEIPMMGLRKSIIDKAQGRLFQVMTSPLLALNVDGLKENDPVRMASQNADVFVLELLRGFSAAVFQWSDVLRVFGALAEAA